MIDRSKIRFAFLLALVSGFAALVHELLWTRRLIDLLGASTQSSSRVFGFFFLGLSFGAAIAARWMHRVKRPWRAVALAELGVAVLSLPMLWLPQWSDWIWPALGMERLVQWPGVVVKTVVSGVIIVPPALCMGLVLPFLTHGLLRRTHRLETHGVRLYAVNTLGGAVGLLAAVLCLLPLLGAAASMVCAMALNVAVAVGAFVLEGVLSGETAAANKQSCDSDRERKPIPRALLFAAFFSGTGILAAEVIANQMLLLVATLSFYAPAAILFAVIASLAAGAFLAPRLRRRAAETSCGFLIMVAMGLAAVALAAGPIIFMSIVRRVDLLAMNASVGEFVIKLVLLAFVSLGPGFLLAGLVFPLTISWLAEEVGDRDGKKLGWLLAFNGLGGVAGAEIAYGILLPLFNIHAALGAVAIGYVIAALALWLASLRSIYWGMIQAGVLGSVVLLMFLQLQHLPLVSKRWGNAVLDQRSGREGSVAVVLERDSVNRCIIMDNQYLLGGTSVRETEERQANLPLLLHAAPKDVAFIGLATGITPGAALLHSNLDSVTVIELSPLVARAADQFLDEFNHGITQSDRARVLVDDGRTAIASAPGRFDVVVGDLFLPGAPGEARLYSVEHFRAVRRSLRQGGVFCQWLAMYQLTPGELEILAATFQKVFPHTYFFCNSLDSQRPTLALVGFQGDEELNWRTIAECCEAGQKNTSLNQDPWLRNVASVAQLYLGEWKPLPSGDSAINTLGNLRIELDAGRELITAGPQTRYLYGRRWLEFCEERRSEMAAEGLPMNSPLTLSSLEHASNLAREILRVQSQMQSR